MRGISFLLSTGFPPALLLLPVLAWAQPAPVPTGEAEQPPQLNAREQDLVSKIWWNHPQKVEEVKLTTEQRSAMDKILASFLEARREQNNAQRQDLAAFGQALARGDSEAARQQREVYIETVADPLRRQLDMMIAVSDQLTPQQRQELLARYPKLFSRLWIRTVNPRNVTGAVGRKRGGQ